jgi:hypothetical protein
MTTLARSLLALALLSVATRSAAGPPPPSAASSDGRPSVAVLAFEAAGASPSLAAAAGAAVGMELDRLAAFRVMTADAVKGALSLQRQREMLGCSGAGCSSDVAAALGTEYVVSGRVASLAGEGGAPARFTLDVTLTRAETGKREGSAVESAASEAELIQAVPRAVSKMAETLLAARSGRLALASAEAGATVKVDGQVRGTTPLPGVLVLPGGVHAVSVEKEGFVAFRKDVAIPPNGYADEQVVLAPSPDFVKGWESRNRKLRIGAWAATGAAAAGAVAFVALQLRASSIYGGPNSPNTFEYYRALLNAGVTVQDGVDVRARATSLKNDMQSAERLSFVGAGVGLVGAGFATWLWIAGDSPDKYARFRDAPQLTVVPTPGGALAAWGGTF